MVAHPLTQWLQQGSTRSRWLAAACITLFLATEAAVSFGSWAQPAFRSEFRFLREQAAKLPPTARLCMLDARLNHYWGDNRLDFDTLYWPNGAAGHTQLGVGAKIMLLNHTLSGAANCTHIFYGAMCQLPPFERQADERLKADRVRLVSICAAVKSLMAKRARVSEEVAVYWFHSKLNRTVLTLQIAESTQR